MAGTIIRKVLTEPFLEQGIQDTNFFNGRLLTAGDLVRVQDASRHRDRQLGRAVGPGVIEGLEVRLVADGTDGQPPVLAVSKGLAIDGLGHAIDLPQKVEVLLDREPPGEESTNGAYTFDICTPFQQNGEPLPGKGAYVFAIRSASGHRGSSPRRGFGQAAKVEGCDRDLLVEGVQFRLVTFDINSLENLSTATRLDLTELLDQVDASGADALAARNQLRNWLAHACFGTEELANWPGNPFQRLADDFFGSAVRSAYHTYGVVDDLHRQQLLDDCDVPLALVCWTQTGVKWVDMWSVRRRPARSTQSTSWPLAFSDRRRVEGEAMWLQFQEHLEALTRSSSGAPFLSTLEARSHFRYLPAVGLLPVGGFGAAGAISYDTFFNEMTIRDPIFIEGAQVHPLLNEGLTYPPIDTTAETVLWLYTVRENVQASQAAPQITRTYLVFASGHTPYRGEARYDVHHWDFGNYS